VFQVHLAYTVSPEDIETVLTGNGFDNFQNIHISIDPVSGRNPGYCFVDFADRETAEIALSTLSAVINGRELKVGPCEPKKPRAKRHETAFQRWGDWRSGSTDENGETQSPSRQLNGERGPRAALDHFEEVLDGQNDGRRLYVGGLTKVVDQAENAEEMKQLLQGHNPVAIGKRTTPHPGTWGKKGNFHYCFVDFATNDEAIEAQNALDGKQYRGGRLRVNVSSNTPRNLRDGKTDIKFSKDQDGEQQQQQQQQQSPRGPRTPSRAIASANWRRKD